MRRIWALAIAAALLAAPAPAAAEFGLHGLSLSFEDEAGSPAMEAGTHPFASITNLEANTIEAPGVPIPDGQPRDVLVTLPEGLVGDPFAVPRCSAADFLDGNVVLEGSLGGTVPNCPDSSAVGLARVSGSATGVVVTNTVAVYNLVPPPGVAARLGLQPIGAGRVTIDLDLRESPPYNILASARSITQMQRFYSSRLTLWGDPSNSVHDDDRGVCGSSFVAFGIEGDLGEVLGIDCPANFSPRPFVTMPRSCPGDRLPAHFFARSWAGGTFEETAFTEDPVIACEALGFEPQIDAEPTARSASAPSGLDFALEVDDEGLTDPAGTADSDISKAVVTLPRGMAINPSQAEGLDVCSIEELARESSGSAFGAGCPGAAKIGTVEVETPLLENRLLKGTLFVAEPHDNLAGDSLIALYMTIKEPRLGISVKLAGRVEPERGAGPDAGRITATFEDLPQIPFSSFRLRFREGGRSPLITPPACGTHTVEGRFSPSGAPGKVFRTDAEFEISSGVGGGPCPPGGALPFAPGFAAGALNNDAAAHSPFLMRLTRPDGHQDMTGFDATLPPGAVAKLAGVPWCPEAAIARARGKDGKDELASPSCPLASQIGTVQGGAGVGPQLTYVPGRIYLAGPTGGAPLSVVAIVPAVAGPFDVGTIVVRQALDLDPITGRAKVVSAASDDLPHILAGIPLRVRDIQVSVDRPNFTLNPTNCAPMATLAGIWGGGSDAFSAHDDFPVLRSARFQAANCAALGFEPRLAIKLRGGVRRGAHPALRAHVRPRPGDANFSRAVVTLPRSAFLDQAHIRTICTRVQFAAGPGHGALCPPASRYGFARAWSPLLDAPAQGPVYLRSSDNNLPDLVAALTGPPSAAVQVELSARIDSVKGGIRSTFAAIPDLPVSRFILDMQGGKKGLIVNSRHLCHEPKRNRARANLRGQNGRFSRTKPRVIATKCVKRRKAKKRRNAKRASVSRALIAGQSASRR